MNQPHYHSLLAPDAEAPVMEREIDRLMDRWPLCLKRRSQGAAPSVWSQSALRPISRNPRGQALAGNELFPLRSTLCLHRAQEPAQRPLHFSKATLDMNPYSSSFQPQSIDLLHVSLCPFEDHLAPGPAQVGVEAGVTVRY